MFEEMGLGSLLGRGCGSSASVGGGVFGRVVDGEALK